MGLVVIEDTHKKQRYIPVNSLSCVRLTSQQMCLVCQCPFSSSSCSFLPPLLNDNINKVNSNHNPLSNSNFVTRQYKGECMLVAFIPGGKTEYSV